jgi:hypothetical protein
LPDDPGSFLALHGEHFGAKEQVKMKVASRARGLRRDVSLRVSMAARWGVDQLLGG